MSSLHFSRLAFASRAVPFAVVALSVLTTGSAAGCRPRFASGEFDSVSCSNGIDDDSDFTTDCDDPGCLPFCGGPGTDAAPGSDGGTGAICGDQVVSGGEDCEGTDLNGETCVSLGFGGGTLVCTAGCLFNTVNCTGVGTCGDDSCDAGGGETCSTCPVDCGSCCGNGTCSGGETCSSCPSDCGSCGGTCGDGSCGGTETCTTCAIDCGSCCGNGVCSGGETCSTCSFDCGSCCGNGVCSGGETCSSCPSDCGTCAPVCGNGLCQAGETCSSCPTDCGSCGPICGDGVCSATETCTSCPFDCFGYSWSEDFSDSFAGWFWDTEWNIAPTFAGTYGDPATDHTAGTSDNGVAGVVIGGGYAVTVHGYYYLYSPYLDTSLASGTLYFDFWRWLQSDYDPYVINTVDIYDGSTWWNLFQSGTVGINDTSWTYQTFDITAYKDSFMQIRWGFTVLSSSAYTEAGWNIDDVEIYSASCP